MMTKIELAKMLGLNCDGWYDSPKIDKWQVENLLRYDWNGIEQTFCDEKIKVSVQQEDLEKDKLNIKAEDLIKDEDARLRKG